MPFACNIPIFYGFVRSEYLYDLQSHHEDLDRVCVFAVDSVSGHAIGFDCMTNFGAQFARLPISAFCWKRDAPDTPLPGLELWNNFSYSVEAIEYEYLQQLRCRVQLGKQSQMGVYMFSLSWYGSRYAEDPGEGGFKRAHIIKLDDGNFAAQPNNRIQWFEPSFITEKFPRKPDFKTNSHTWNCENQTGWSTSNDDRYFYEVNNELEGTSDL